jgi:PAS domain S-box-containing protein
MAGYGRMKKMEHRMTRHSHDKTSFPIGAKILLPCIVLVLLAGGAWFFLAQQKHQRDQVAENLLSIANLKAKQLVEWRAERMGDALVLMDRRALASSIQRFLAGNEPQEASEILRRLRSTKEQYNYTDIFLVDSQKELRLAFELKESGHEQKGYVAAFKSAVEERRPVWSRIHMGEVHPSPHLSIVVPIIAGENDENPAGVLVLVCDASQFLYPLIQSWPTPSDTAETLLVRRDGDEVLFLNDLRHQKGTALKLSIPVDRTDLPAARAVAGETGIVEGKDYRGVEVLAAILPVKGSPWFIVSKMDKSEAFAEWRFRSILILVFIFAGLGLVAAAWFLIGQHRQKAYYQRLYTTEADLSQAHRQHAITLEAIGDGVIATDAGGRVEFMNPTAEKLTGWRKETAVGKNLTEVLKLVAEETGVSLENPAVQAMREDRIVNLAVDTLLVAKDGKKIPVADSASPIRNGQGRPVGAVIVFNDRSEAREYQKRIIESEEKYRLLADNTLDVIWTMDMDLYFTYVNPSVKKHLGIIPENLVGKHLREFCTEAEFHRLKGILTREVEHPSEHQGVTFESELRREDGSLIPLEVHALFMFDEKGRFRGIQGTSRDITERLERERAMQHLQEELSEARKMEAIGRLAGGVAHDYNNMLNIITGYAELGMVRVDPKEPLHADLQQITKAAERAAGITRKLLAFARKQMVMGEAIDLNRELEGMVGKLKQQLGEDIGLVTRPGSELWPVRMDPSQLAQIMSNLCDNARDAMGGSGQVSIETGNACFDAGFCENRPGFCPGDFVMLSFTDNGKGMDKETIDNVFEPFFTTKPFGESAGLGMAVVYGIVKQNNGFLDVDSEPGKGTTFRLYLPRYSVPGGN